jgi:hypothetical protein
MKFPPTPQQYSVFSKRLQVALLAFSGAVILIAFCIKACSHVDMISPEGIHNGESKDRDKDRSDRNKDRGDRGGDRESKGDSDRSGGGRKK